MSIFANEATIIDKQIIHYSESNLPGGKIPLVSRDPAIGTIVLQWILYFLPSKASVLHKPRRPNLAALNRIKTFFIQQI